MANCVFALRPLPRDAFANKASSSSLRSSAVQLCGSSFGLPRCDSSDKYRVTKENDIEPHHDIKADLAKSKSQLLTWFRQAELAIAQEGVGAVLMCYAPSNEPNKASWVRKQIRQSTDPFWQVPKAKRAAAWQTCEGITQLSYVNDTGIAYLVV